MKLNETALYGYAFVYGMFYNTNIMSNVYLKLNRHVGFSMLRYPFKNHSKRYHFHQIMHITNPFDVI